MIGFRRFDNDYAAGVVHGDARGRVAQRQIDRARAFAALRRAVAVARAADADARLLRAQGSHDTASFADSEALGIRRAIRAALGTPHD